MTYTRRHFCALTAGAACVPYMAWGAAQFDGNLKLLPNGAVTIIVPFSIGGTSDLLVRALQKTMSRLIQREVIIKNVPGRGGTVGTFEAALSAPNGSTLLLGNLGTHSSAPALYGTLLKYNPETDFIPLALLASTPVYLIGRNDLTTPDGAPIRDFATLRSTLRQNPWRYTLAHLGKGSTSYLAGLQFMQLTKINMQQIVYRGGGPALRDLQDGVFDLLFDQSASVVGVLRNKEALPFLYASAARSPLMPQLPNVTDIGLPEMAIDGWNMLFIPKNTPPAVVMLWNQIILATLRSPDVRQQYDTYNAILFDDEQNTPVLLRRFLKREQTRWGSVLQAAHVLATEEDDVEDN